MTPPAELDPRKLMELAVDVMRQSIAEPRADAKASPRVGAVLWKPDGTVETACRGELRDGDHAEYTLLERKNRDARLDGAALFVTLEPCAPGSRHEPKLGCAERIVNARIKDVWVGIEDPDPKVDRKGIKYLQDTGVTVRMFDRDLQEVIQEENREFIAQALERAAAARKAKPKAALLSSLEEAFANTATDDLSDEALEMYWATAGMRDKVGSAAFYRRLAQQGLLTEKDGRWTPTGYGFLLFGKEPRTVMPQAGLLGTIHYPDGREETRDFDGPQILAPEQALQWLRDKLPNPIDRSEARRRESNAALFELIREGIVNALVHRDYEIAGGKCQLVATPERVEVWSPGLPVEPVTLEQVQAFEAPMLSRNPVLHFVFARLDLAEERGLGLKSMRNRAQAAGMPLPAYSYKAPYVVLTLYREAKAALPKSRGDMLAQLSEAERTGWDWLATREVVTTAEYQDAMGIPLRTARFQLGHLSELGLLRRVGSARATRYEVLRG
ncbi:MAG: ATP-binding protein [Candidatus Bipolaricaulota bacterium]